MIATAQEHLTDLAEFVTASPTSYHAAATLAGRLAAAGFEELDLRRPLPGVAGKRFVRRGGAVVAWLAPEQLGEDAAFRIVGTHTDSPSFKIKPGEQLHSADWQQVGVEVYGGPLFNSWLDRDLGVAGRLVTRDGTHHLVQSGAIARIPQLAIHLARGVNTDGLRLDPQQHLQPVVAAGPEGSVLGHLAQLAGLHPGDVAGHDLYLFDTQRPGVVGVNGEFFASARLDNLSSTHAGLTALERLAGGTDVAVLVAFDHEEVGSATTTGAAGPLLEHVLERISGGYGLGADAARAMLARSSCISADSGHLVHPNYVGHHDPQNQPQPNRGPLLKLNANQRYATDGEGAGIWLEACNRAEVPTQPFVSNNAMPCGSTIGPITATRLGITTVDVGIGLLSMHSARELCGTQDPWYLARALEAYYTAS